MQHLSRQSAGLYRAGSRSGPGAGAVTGRYGTHAYIVAEADVRHRCQAYREVFPGAEIAYAGGALEGSEQEGAQISGPAGPSAGGAGREYRPAA